MVTTGYLYILYTINVHKVRFIFLPKATDRWAVWFSWVSAETLMDQQALVPTGPTSAPAMAAR